MNPFRDPVHGAVMRGLVPLALALAAGACSNARADTERGDGFADSASAPTPREIVVTASDFAYRSADTVPAGMTRIRLRNDGPDIHHVHLVRIDSGHTTAELFARLSAGDLDIPWMTLVGGPEIPAMGTESEVTLDLPAGQYAMFCVVPSLDGVRHVAKGMFRALTVTPSATPVAAVEPKADVRMVLSDYAFTLTPELTRGVHTVRVENEAEQPHMVVLLRLHAGKTAVDAEQWSKHRQGPPPFDEAGGTTAIARGKAVFFTTDVTPADYLLLCFWPDAKDGRSHAAHGMVRQITIR